MIAPKLGEIVDDKIILSGTSFDKQEGYIIDANTNPMNGTKINNIKMIL